ncbi:hypothetical protein PHMEG_00020645 [Phytophthora megakarya]|uniref:Uncharacterized protein n=1 Tax=Phytophthora megakarya TaxID=4795 RepID=A0A225VPR6_9STRA|nr:hypothetical protein PHMEG_00020645 [Phytophthora megakarya]
MVLATCPRHDDFTRAQIAGFYFRSCRDDHDEVIPRVLPLSGVSAIDSLTRLVGRAIATGLPGRFGLLFDGWTHASEHYIAGFAYYEEDAFT